MPRSARLALVGIFLVAAVDDPAVFISRVPDLRTVVPAAAAAFDLVREDAHAAVLASLFTLLGSMLKARSRTRNGRLRPY